MENCATELLIDVYLHLDNIDDALHLARCSKRINAVYETHRLHILKSIIVSGNSRPATAVYRIRSSKDFWLTVSSSLPAPTLTMLNSAITKTLFRNSARSTFTMVLNLRFPFSIHRRPFLTSATMQSLLATGEFWDIVARWQGLRPLQHLYLDSVINPMYTESPFVTGKRLDMSNLAHHEKKSATTIAKFLLR